MQAEVGLGLNYYKGPVRSWAMSRQYLNQHINGEQSLNQHILNRCIFQLLWINKVILYRVTPISAHLVEIYLMSLLFVLTGLSFVISHCYVNGNACLSLPQIFSATSGENSY